MIRGRVNVTNVIFGVRQIHSSTVLCSVNKQAKMMAKLMTGSLHRKRNWYVNERQAVIPILPDSKQFQAGPLKKRRTDVLNKLFMRTISDLLSTGEIKDLTGLGISITRLKVSPDFNVVNVYWTCKSTSVYDKELEMVLKDASFKLRHEMCQLHVLGKVPRINFVADKTFGALENAEVCFEKMKSMGDFDEEKSSDESYFEYTLESCTVERIRDLEMTVPEVCLPPMTHDVLGVDHHKIMNKIEIAVKKSSASHRYGDHHDHIDVTNVAYSTSSTVGSYGSVKGDIAKFITKQKIKKKKEMRQMKKDLMDISLDDSTYQEEYVDIEDGDSFEEYDASSTREV